MYRVSRGDSPRTEGFFPSGEAKPSVARTVSPPVGPAPVIGPPVGPAPVIGPPVGLAPVIGPPVGPAPVIGRA